MSPTAYARTQGIRLLEEAVQEVGHCSPLRKSCRWGRDWGCLAGVF